MKREYIVRGWLNGDDYDAGKPATYSVYVMAANESQADDLGEKKLNKKFGRFDVIVSELFYHSDKKASV